MTCFATMRGTFWTLSQGNQSNKAERGARWGGKPSRGGGACVDTSYLFGQSEGRDGYRVVEGWLWLKAEEEREGW